MSRFPSACRSAQCGADGHRQWVPPARTDPDQPSQHERRKRRRGTPKAIRRQYVGSPYFLRKRRLRRFSQPGWESGAAPVNNPPMPVQAPKIHAIYRYPVKGLSPEPLGRTALAVGATVPGDRLYAVENGPSGFDPAAPRYQPKQRYLMLMQNERLARLRTRFDERSQVLTIDSEGREAARGDLPTADGRATVESFLAAYCADEL